MTTNIDTELAISEAEWEVMRVVWSQGSITNRQLIDTLILSKDWKEGTIKTLLTRLTQKGYIKKDISQSPYLYTATIKQQDANIHKMHQSLAHVCNKKHGTLLFEIIKDIDLSKNDISALQDLLRNKMDSAPVEVACHCEPGKCQCYYE
ncbi:CopY/TcrY family copper transport repressor [Aerococcaceae bacterium DSM 111020]|nr:CopY/TcrY family copper transport repressor [Aerococcaceae bacterium DSM 111020]